MVQPWTTNPTELIGFQFFTTPQMTDAEAYNALSRSIIASGLLLGTFKPNMATTAAFSVLGALLVQKIMWHTTPAAPPAATTEQMNVEADIPAANVVPPSEQKPEAFSALLSAPTTLIADESDPSIQYTTAPMPGAVSRISFAPKKLRPGLSKQISIPAMRLVTATKEASARGDMQGTMEDRVYACRPTGNLEFLATEDFSWADGNVGPYKSMMKPRA